jgi:hypothetical protein
MPAGRTASEVARASALAASVGTLRAATAGAQLQAAALVADGAISGACLLVVELTGGDVHHLAAMLGGNLALTATTGISLLFLIRHQRLAHRLAARFPRLLASMARGDAKPAALGLAACAWSMLGRSLSCLQYGIAVFALGGGFSLRRASIAYGVRAVAGTVGVGLPAQVGVADGAYLLFADVLGFASEPARAVALILAIRTLQVLLALVGLLIPVLVQRVGAVPTQGRPS